MEIIAGKLVGHDPNMLFFGSSGAGFTSIGLAALTKTQALAINPQLDCLLYNEGETSLFLASCLKRDEKPLPERLNIYNLLNKVGYIPRVSIYQNLSDGHDMESQIIPFMKKCASLAALVEPFEFIFYNIPGGHNVQPPKEDLICAIHRLLDANSRTPAG